MIYGYETLAAGWETKQINRYLQFQLGMHYRFIEQKKWSIRAELTPFFGYWIQKKVVGQIPNLLNYQLIEGDNGQVLQELTWTNFSEQVVFNNQEDHRVDAGIVSSFVFQLQTKQLHYFIQPFYEWSFLERRRKTIAPQSTILNRTIGVKIGIIKKF